jgi:hypothetical protein
VLDAIRFSGWNSVLSFRNRTAFKPLDKHDLRLG